MVVWDRHHHLVATTMKKVTKFFALFVVSVVMLICVSEALHTLDTPDYGRGLVGGLVAAWLACGLTFYWFRES